MLLLIVVYSAYYFFHFSIIEHEENIFHSNFYVFEKVKRENFKLCCTCVFIFDKLICNLKKMIICLFILNLCNNKCLLYSNILKSIFASIS